MDTHFLVWCVQSRGDFGFDDVLMYLVDNVSGSKNMIGQPTFILTMCVWNPEGVN